MPSDKYGEGAMRDMVKSLRFLVAERRHVQLGVVDHDLLAAASAIEQLLEDRHSTARSAIGTRDAALEEAARLCEGSAVILRSRGLRREEDALAITAKSIRELKASPLPDLEPGTVVKVAQPAEYSVRSHEPRSLSEFVRADEATRERIGAEVAAGAVERQVAEDPFFQPFDCHYDGDINRCDKDCKQLGQCKRRTTGPLPTVPAGLDFPPRSSTRRTEAVIAKDAIDLFCEYRDKHGYSEESAAVFAVNEFTEAEHFAPSAKAPQCALRAGCRMKTNQCLEAGHCLNYAAPQGQGQPPVGPSASGTREQRLEDALRHMVYFDRGRWHGGIRDDADVTDLVGDLLGSSDGTASGGSNG